MDDSGVADFFPKLGEHTGAGAGAGDADQVREYLKQVGKGYRFSTYATWWIRQAITKALAGQPPAGQPPAGQPPAGQPPAGEPPAGPGR